MFTRKEAIEVIREKFPKTETKTGIDYANYGGTKQWVVSPEWRLEKMIDLAEPTLDALKTDDGSLDERSEELFRQNVEIDYKNENGLW
jgi:hypothetical protein